MNNYETIVICNALAVLCKRYGFFIDLRELYEAMEYSANQLGITVEEAAKITRLDVNYVVSLLAPTVH